MRLARVALVALALLLLFAAAKDRGPLIEFKVTNVQAK